MKKLFVSCPMNGKTFEEIVEVRKEAIKLIKKKFPNGEFEVLKTFFDFEEGTHPLKYMAESIRMLADADVAYFAKDWHETRGCKIEHDCAVAYGIEIVDEYQEPKEEKEMNKYVGCKCVEAEPCKAWKDMGTHKIGEDGYKVVYPDGYVSWSPKDVFEAVYMEVPCAVPQDALRKCTKQIVLGLVLAEASKNLN